MEKYITIKELQEICNVKTPQVMLQFVKSNLESINKDGIHAEKAGKSWAFDDIAVKRIKELRNITAHAAVIMDDGKMQELREENSNLKTQLLLTQNLVTKNQEKIILLQDEIIKGVKLLGTAENNAATASAKSEELNKSLDKATSKIEELTAAKLAAETVLEELMKDLERQKKENARLQQQLQEEKGKGFFDKLLGR